jgi:hypothetical protein
MCGADFLRLRTAKEWGLTPSGWALEPRWSQIQMLAYTSVDEEIKAQEAKELKAKTKR